MTSDKTLITFITVTMVSRQEAHAYGQSVIHDTSHVTKPSCTGGTAAM